MCGAVMDMGGRVVCGYVMGGWKGSVWIVDGCVVSAWVVCG